MNKFESDYFDLIEEVLTDGTLVGDRTKTGTYSIFTADMKVNLLRDGFPILSCREFKIEQQLVEMIGFMRGITNSEWYKERGCPFWNKFGLPEDIYRQERKQDHELANEFCSEKGKYQSHEPEYLAHYAQLNAVSFEDGLAMIEKEDIKLYKDILVGKKGDLGPIYGHMWRNWPGKNGTVFDQLRYAFEELRLRPHNRRILINGWNPTYMPDFNKKPHENVPDGNMSLTPCHVLHEYYTSPIDITTRVAIYNSRVRVEHAINVDDPNAKTKLDAAKIPEYYLSLCWFQRSWDLVLGAPANMGGYAAMLIMMAKLQNMIPQYVAVKAVQVHIYQNHLEGVREMIRRADYGLIPECAPELVVNVRPEVDFIDQFEPSDFILEGYEHLDPIKFPIAV